MIPRSKVPRRFLSLYKVFPRRKTTTTTQNGPPAAVSQAEVAPRHSMPSDQPEGAGNPMDVNAMSRSLTEESLRDRGALGLTNPWSTLSHGAPSMQQRAFHGSASQAADAPSTTFQERTQIPKSSWHRPPLKSQDADDNIVPIYYTERKRQRDSILERKEEEGGLMAELSAGILSDGVAAHTRPREEKIPVEVRAPDGSVLHPSGFEPPTPETEFHPAVAKVSEEGEAADPDAPITTLKQLWDERKFQTEAAAPHGAPRGIDTYDYKNTLQRVLKAQVAQATTERGKEAEQEQHKAAVRGQYGASDVREQPGARADDASSSSFEQRADMPVSAWDDPGRVRSGVRPREDVVPSYYIERKRQRDTISEREEEEGGLMAELNAGILSDGVATHMRPREEKMPVEVTARDGSVVHPSGFEPPTPETEFHPTAAKPAESPPKTPWTELPLWGR